MRPFYLAFILAGLLIAGCSKSNEDAIYRKNSMYGYAITLDEVNQRDSVNNVKVDVISGDKIYSAVSNDSGYWEIPDVQTGTYSIRVSKEGYVGNETMGKQFTMWEKTNTGYQAVYKKFDHPLDYFHVSSDTLYITIAFSFDESGWEKHPLFMYTSKIEVKAIQADTTIVDYSSVYDPARLGQFFLLTASDTVYTRFVRSLLKDQNDPGTSVEVSLRVGGNIFDTYNFDYYKDLDQLPTQSDVLGSETITLP